jgi:hypothetical protein
MTPRSCTIVCLWSIIVASWGRGQENRKPIITIELIKERHLDGYRKAVDLVAREEVYMARTEAPSFEEMKAFVREEH